MYQIQLKNKSSNAKFKRNIKSYDIVLKTKNKKIIIGSTYAKIGVFSVDMYSLIVAFKNGASLSNKIEKKLQQITTNLGSSKRLSITH